jgi:hypothetical protein
MGAGSLLLLYSHCFVEHLVFSKGLCGMLCSCAGHTEMLTSSALERVHVIAKKAGSNIDMLACFARLEAHSMQIANGIYLHRRIYVLSFTFLSSQKIPHVMTMFSK